MANSDNKAFDMMTTVADKTAVELFPEDKSEKSTKSIHTALMAAGMTPAYGNVADLADATLYALEGEFGEAAWSSAAAIPFIGQMVSGKRALKAAKEAGEEMVTVYRGIPQWFKKREKSLYMGEGVKDTGWGSGGMVKEGKFIGGGGSQNWAEMPIKKTAIWVTDSKKWASSGRFIKEGGDAYKSGKAGKGHVLEFEMPKSYFEKNAIEIVPKGTMPRNKRIIFQDGIPKEFLKKVHK